LLDGDHGALDLARCIHPLSRGLFLGSCLGHAVEDFLAYRVTLDFGFAKSEDTFPHAVDRGYGFVSELFFVSLFDVTLGHHSSSGCDAHLGQICEFEGIGDPSDGEEGDCGGV